MREDVHRFDTSDYPPHNIYNIPLVNKKVPGKMKDEMRGVPPTAFVGLRSKMYSLQIHNEEDYIKKVKGVKS